MDYLQRIKQKDKIHIYTNLEKISKNVKIKLNVRKSLN